MGNGMAEEAVDERVRTIISNIFNTPADEINAGSSPETIEAWDSMGHLMLILELEQEFGIQIPPEEVEKMTSVGAVRQALARCGAD